MASDLPELEAPCCPRRSVLIMQWSTSANMEPWHHKPLHGKCCSAHAQGKVHPQAIPELDHFRDYGSSPNKPGNVPVPQSCRWQA